MYTGGKKPNKEAAARLAKIREVANMYFMLDECEEGKPFYYKFYSDFRGRIYADSEVGPTQNKAVRYSIKFATKQSNVSRVMLEYEAIYRRFGKGTEYETGDNIKKMVFSRVLVDIGKIYKSKLATPATFMDFAELGHKMLNQSKLSDLDDQLVYNQSVKALEVAFKEGECRYPFYSDATASGLQVLCLLLGPVDPKIAEYLNLTSRTKWYDPYKIIIEWFLKEYNINESNSEYFVRKHLKKTIMIVNYMGTLNTCFEGFMSNIGKEVSLDERRGLFADHRQFYVFVNSIFSGTKFFKSPSATLVKLLGPEAKIQFKD